MKKLLLLLSVGLAALLMVACQKIEYENHYEVLPAGEYKIYCTDKGTTQLFWEYYDAKETEEIPLIEELLDKLDHNPANAIYKKVKPDSVKLNSYYFGIDNQLVLDFSSEYSQLSTVDELLLRAAYVKTLCQIKEIEYIEFTVEGLSLFVRSDSPVGQMNASTFIDNTGSTVDFMQTVKMTVYFADASGAMMEDSMLTIEYEGRRTLPELVMEQLIGGPLAELSHLYPVMSKEVVLNKIYVNDGVCYVDLSESFLDQIANVEDEIKIYSVVNSLVELPDISKVHFLINGEERKSFSGIDFSDNFERRPDLIITERAGE